MKIVTFILFFTSFIQLGFGQNELVKVDTIYSTDGIAHRIINYKSKSKSNHLELALKCKVKADSLLKAHFDLEFFNDYIYFDAEGSRWYNVNNNSRTTELFNYKKETPKKVELVYSILNKNSDFFNLIEITLDCENEIKIVNSIGIPETANYKINIDYNQAMKIANKKGFKENEVSEDYEIYSADLETLSLDFSYENNYQWIIHKNIKREFGKQLGRCSSATTTSKALFINAESGKTKTKKSKSVRSVYWF